MSTDYDVVCDTCRVSLHAGQLMGSDASFGHGSQDLPGHAAVARFVFGHALHGPRGPRFEISDASEGRLSDDYDLLDEAVMTKEMLVNLLEEEVHPGPLEPGHTLDYPTLAEAFHELWTKAVGTTGYVKRDWLAMEAKINAVWRTTGLPFRPRRKP